MSFEKNKREAWNRYWESGFLTTFTAQKGENYSGLIKDFWEAQLIDVEGESTLVDCAAGNGAILSLVMNYMRQRNRDYNLVAVDYANIVEGSDFYKNNPNIKVLSETPIEDMGIDSLSVDICTSQYGFEYSDRSKATREIARVLKNNGKFCALIHHIDSPVTAASRLSIDQIDICQKYSLTKIVDKLLRRLSYLKKTNENAQLDQKASKLRDQFNIVAQALLQHGQTLSNRDHINYYLNELSSVFRSKASKLSLAEKLAIVAAVDVDSSLYKNRMKAMLAASCDIKDMMELKSIFEENGFTINVCDELKHGNVIMAWKFIATKV